MRRAISFGSGKVSGRRRRAVTAIFIDLPPNFGELDIRPSSRGVASDFPAIDPQGTFRRRFTGECVEPTSLMVWGFGTVSAILC